MPLTLHHPELERLAKDVTKRTGEPIEQAVLIALQERLERLTLSDNLSLAAERLKKDYEEDTDLTAFTELERREIDRQFEAMAEDESYQEMNQRLVKDFAEED